MDNLYDVKVNGIGKLNKGCYKNIEITGATTISGDIQGESIHIEGRCKAYGNIVCNKFFSEGTLTSTGGIDAKESIYLEGLINITGSLQGKEIKSNGKLTVNGLMSGDRIRISIMGTNRIKEIGGEEVTIRIVNKGIFSNPKLITTSIEADEINIENTSSDIIRGHNVTIKGGCRIKRLEYTGELFIDNSSSVLEVIKL